MYEIGKIYIWQNLHEHAYLNGTETTVLGPLEWFGTVPGVPLIQYCETDTVLPDGRCLWATCWQLRPINPPDGERMITDLFKSPEGTPA